ncbi:MAG TPA: hydroxyisourate hydrolase [Candidatus Dormibacteraeota bacterium]|nr:hydroxyisourate hydrolase [Candidatus Dormibacteraeota bacterium]
MILISTHVLDTTRGRPAAGLAVTLRRRGPDGDWSVVGRAVTDADGRVKDLSTLPLAGGDYRLEFATGEYFKALGTAVFYPEVFVTVAAADGDSHLHVPLLLSPFGYSTYKGQ